MDLGLLAQGLVATLGMSVIEIERLPFRRVLLENARSAVRADEEDQARRKANPQLYGPPRS